MAKATENQKALTSAIKGIITRLERTEQFVLAQAPEICQQMVREKTFDATVDLASSGLMFLFGIVTFLITAIQMYWHPEGASDSFWIPRGILCLISFPMTGCGLEATIREVKWLYFVKNCPKLFLLREFKKLVE